MKKLIALLLSLSILTASPVFSVTAQRGGVSFALPYSSERCSLIIEENIGGIFSAIAADYGEKINDIAYGEPIGVYNLENCYYVPVYINGEIKYVINISLMEERKPYISFEKGLGEVLSKLSEKKILFPGKRRKYLSCWEERNCKSENKLDVLR